jgi:hypothetical protein
MDPKDWVAEILNPIRTLVNLDLALEYQDVTIIKGKRFYRIGYPESSFEEAIPIAKLRFGSLFEYLEFLKARRYSALLFDGSILQISVEIERGQLIKHRYSYYPCPIEFKKGDLILLSEEEPISDIVESRIENDPTDILLRTPLRFDFDSEVWNFGEPHSHLHFNHPDCHCALAPAIYPSFFIKFVFRHCYPDLWVEHPDLELLAQDMTGYWLKDTEEQFLHLTSKRFYDES